MTASATQDAANIVLATPLASPGGDTSSQHLGEEQKDQGAANRSFNIEFNVEDFCSNPNSLLMLFAARQYNLLANTNPTLEQETEAVAHIDKVSSWKTYNRFKISRVNFEDKLRTTLAITGIGGPKEMVTVAGKKPYETNNTIERLVARASEVVEENKACATQTLTGGKGEVTQYFYFMRQHNDIIEFSFLLTGAKFTMIAASLPPMYKNVMDYLLLQNVRQILKTMQPTENAMLSYFNLLPSHVPQTQKEIRALFEGAAEERKKSLTPSQSVMYHLAYMKAPATRMVTSAAAVVGPERMSTPLHLLKKRQEDGAETRILWHGFTNWRVTMKAFKEKLRNDLIQMKVGHSTDSKKAQHGSNPMIEKITEGSNPLIEKITEGAEAEEEELVREFTVDQETNYKFSKMYLFYRTDSEKDEIEVALMVYGGEFTKTESANHKIPVSAMPMIQDALAVNVLASQNPLTQSHLEMNQRNPLRFNPVPTSLGGWSHLLSKACPTATLAAVVLAFVLMRKSR